LFAFCAPPVGAADPGADLKQIEGRWMVAHRAYTPSKANDRVGQLLTSLGQQVEIKDGKLSPADPKKGDVYLLVSFYPTTKPKAIDLKLPDKKEKALLGIYNLEDDILSLNVGTGDIRPKKFAIQEDQVVLILKRAPKKPGKLGGTTPR